MNDRSTLGERIRKEERAERNPKVTVSDVFLVVSIIGALFTLNTYFSQRRFGPLIVPSFFAGWLTSEMPLHHIAWQGLATLVFVALGALEHWTGWLALGISAGSWVGLLCLIPILRSADEAVEDALVGTFGPNYRDSILPAVSQRMDASPIAWRHLLPFRLRHPGVEVIRDVPYMETGDPRHLLDIHLPRHGVSHAPVLLQIHGGGWVIGNKREQALPLMNHMAARGWICIAVNYRLSPKATFPEHLIDVKRALRWIRENISEYGGNPDFVVATGGSAGGHLSSLLALTANDPEYQPGFEEIETSLRACVPFYGVYDWSDAYDLRSYRGMTGFIERVVMKRKLEQEPEHFRRASPMHRIHPDSPPFFVIHGSHDSLASVEEARHFAKLLAETSKAPVVYAEIPGAQHAFEIFHSLRSSRVIDGVGRFLAHVYSDYLQEQQR